MSLLVPLVGLLALAAYGSAAESAWRSLARSPLPAPATGALGRLAADLERDPRRLLTAAFLLKHAANVAAVAVATFAARDFWPRYALGLSILGMTVVLLLAVELLPGRLAARRRLAAARLTLPLYGLARLLGGLVAPLRGLPAACAPAAGEGVTEAELLTMVAAVHGGDIKEREKQLIHNIFEFDDTRVSEIMTPRADMFVVDADRPLDLETVFRSGFSRIPVIERDIDRIVGILNIKDLLLHPAGQRPPEVRAIMREPYQEAGRAAAGLQAAPAAPGRGGRRARGRVRAGHARRCARAAGRRDQRRDGHRRADDRCDAAGGMAGAG